MIFLMSYSNRLYGNTDHPIISSSKANMLARAERSFPASFPSSACRPVRLGVFQFCVRISAAD